MSREAIGALLDSSESEELDGMLEAMWRRCEAAPKRMKAELRPGSHHLPPMLRRRGGPPLRSFAPFCPWRGAGAKAKSGPAGPRKGGFE